MNPHFDNRNGSGEPLAEDVGAFLERWRAPAPDLQAKARLKAQLMDMLVDATVVRSHRMSLSWVWLIARAQLRLVHPAIWVGSALVMALGALVTPAVSQPTLNGSQLPFVLVAPVAAALGVAFLYGGSTDPPRELQLSTPVSPRVILLARLALLFGFNLMLGLIGSVALTLGNSPLSLMPLILAWLAPMTFLSALAFLLSALFLDPAVSILISLGLWATLVAGHLQLQLPKIGQLPDLLRGDIYPLMFLLAAALVALALHIADREERWTGVSA